MNNFQSSDDQVTIEVNSESLMLRNVIDTNAEFNKLIRTQVTLKGTEFDSYEIKVDTTITYSLKEFKALLAFAEALNLPLQLLFETTGKPAVFVIHNGCTFEANFVLATSKADSTTQTTSTQKTSNVERKKRKDSTQNSSNVRKKPHLETEISKCLDEDSHLFNFIDIPDENCVMDFNNTNNKADDKDTNCDINTNGNNVIDSDNIPASPTSRTVIKTIFKRCFEKTFDIRGMQQVVLAENSDSE